MAMRFIHVNSAERIYTARHRRIMNHRRLEQRYDADSAYAGQPAVKLAREEQFLSHPVPTVIEIVTLVL
jgi:hypothetical protein